MALKNALTKPIYVGFGEGSNGRKIFLRYVPVTQTFQVYIGKDLDNVYSVFGAQMAIDRFNELMKL